MFLARKEAIAAVALDGMCSRSDRIDCVYLHGLYGLCKSGFVIFHATYNARSFFRLAESEFHLPANRAHTLRAGLTPILIFAVRLAL